jgi:putative SOS response-associated peptidase YedK
MCGRVVTQLTEHAVAEIFAMATADIPEFTPHWNAAPGVEHLVVANDGGRRRARRALWGFPAAHRRMVNARGETAHALPAFRRAFERRRVLMPVTGFFEWGSDAPWLFIVDDGAPFAIGAIAADDEALPFCLLTTVANERLAPGDFAAWLDPRTPLDAVRALLRPTDAARVTAHPVTPRVGDVKNDDPEVVAPFSPPQLRLL